LWEITSSITWCIATPRSLPRTALEGRLILIARQLVRHSVPSSMPRVAKAPARRRLSHRTPTDAPADYVSSAEAAPSMHPSLDPLPLSTPVYPQTAMSAPRSTALVAPSILPLLLLRSRRPASPSPRQAYLLKLLMAASLRRTCPQTRLMPVAPFALAGTAFLLLRVSGGRSMLPRGLAHEPLRRLLCSSPLLLFRLP
jgi:hypothetical protein